MANLGQRQQFYMIWLFNVIKLDQGLQHFSLARLNIDNGTLNIIFIPQEPDEIFIKSSGKGYRSGEFTAETLKDKTGKQLIKRKNGREQYTGNHYNRDKVGRHTYLLC